MHLLDEEELAHVGKILRKGYVRVHKPKKKPSVKDILLSVLFSLLALLFLALSVYCIYWVINGLYLIVALPGFVICAALLGMSLREIHLSLDDNMPSLGSKRWSVMKSPPNFLPDPNAQADSPSHQSSTISSYNDSSRDFKSEGSTSIFKSNSADVVVKYSTFEESVQFVKDPKMIRSVSQYAVDNVPNQDQLIVKTVPQSSFSSSRKRFCHNFETEEDLIETKTLPFLESIPVATTKEVDKVSEKGSSQSLPAIHFVSNSDT